MKKLILFVLLFFCGFVLGAQPKKVVFYLHGRIVELQGANAIDSVNGFGPYRYRDILDSLQKHFTVISEVRGAGTEVHSYARKVAGQVDSLLKLKVPPQNITIIGASKGALIAMLASAFIQNPQVNFVFMAACNGNNLSTYPEIVFYGNILSIHEKSDPANGACLDFKGRPGKVSRYKETELNTGLRHGFIYRPIAAWLQPTLRWANGNYE